LVELLTGEYVEFGAFGCGVFALSLIFAAYASQTLRGAIQAIAKGQWESGTALGLSKGYTFLHIIMPQVWLHALPGLSNQWLVLLKDTALISLIGVDDLMRQAQLINTNTHQPFTWYGIAALIYLLVTLVSQVGIRKLELRFTRFEREV
jgi:histidine transport system permease protein hisQ